MKGAQLYWQCRRGTKELDLLLTHYLENYYPYTSAAKQKQFTQLLKLGDDELYPAFLAFHSSDAQ